MAVPLPPFNMLCFRQLADGAADDARNLCHRDNLRRHMAPRGGAVVENSGIDVLIRVLLCGPAAIHVPGRAADLRGGFTAQEQRQLAQLRRLDEGQ